MHKRKRSWGNIWPARQRYKNELRWIKNKELRLKRHFKKHPNDKNAKYLLSI